MPPPATSGDDPWAIPDVRSSAPGPQRQRPQAPPDGVGRTAAPPERWGGAAPAAAPAAPAWTASPYPAPSAPGGGWGPAPGQRAPGGSRAWLWGVLGGAGALVALLVVAAVAVLVLQEREDGGGVVAEVPAPSDDGLTSPDAVTDAEVRALVEDELQPFVEQERDLVFLEPVQVEILYDEAFVARLEEADDPVQQAEEIAALGATLTALGLVPPGTDVAAEVDELLAGGVAGFYDPEGDELVVRGQGLGPTERVTLVHELTHALQDQHYDLDRDFADATDESEFGLVALAEGDATLVEDAYVAALPGGDRARYEQERSETELPDVAPGLVALLVEPYVEGPGLVSTVRAEGGTEGLGDAFLTPPTTSEQVLEPELFLAGEPAVPVEAPPADGEVLDDGVLGASGLRLLLGGDITDGWGGDRYVTWRDAASVCTRVAYVGDTPEDTAEVVAAVRAVAAPGTGVEVEADGTDGAPARLLFCVRDAV